jgi:molybdate transport system ATP-binding protein
MVQLSPFERRRPRELSGGQRQRVALARALAREPAVLLMDEPFAALDRASRRELQGVLDRVRRALDVPVILVTHDLEDVARLATHVLLLDGGRAVANEAIAALMSRPDLSALRASTGLGSIFDAQVVHGRSARGLLELAFPGGALLATAVSPMLPAGTPVRVRIPAREVILATLAPEGLSLHNVLRGEVTAIHVEPDMDAAMVQLRVGDIHLLAEVTRDAVARLGLAVGTASYALIKSVSITVLEATPLCL